MTFRRFENLTFKGRIMKADLHSHTTYSDGHLDVKQLIDLAKKEHLDFLAITDHDILTGAKLARELTKHEALEIIVGIELSTYHNEESVHILGYFPPATDTEKLEKFLLKQQQARETRAKKILELLHKHFNIRINPVLLERYETITRGSIADMIQESGYFYEKSEIFDKFLGNGAKAYIPSTKLPTKEGIQILKDAGAIAVLAHPVLLKKSKVEEIVAMGIDGIEAYYPSNRQEDTNRLKDIARKNQLLVTAGSDFHKFEDYKHGTLGQVVLKNKELDRFLTALRGDAK